MKIREIKSSLNILTVLRHYNLSTDKNGMLKCPFHQDKTPSLKIYTRTNTFYCFGCGATGDVIQFIELYEQLNKHTAILKAKKLLNITEPPESEAISGGKAKTPATPFANIKPGNMEQTEDKKQLSRLAVLGKVARDSKTSFKRTAKAKNYLKERGLNPDKMEVGYMGAEFGKGWNPQLKESGLKLGILKKSRQNTIVPKFKNCVLFFTKNEKGQITDLYGRSINPNGEGKHFYLNGRHQGIYPAYPQPETKTIVFTESFIDCATLEQQTELAKRYCFISLFGTNGFTEEIEAAIKELPELEEAVFFLDGDHPGQEATERISRKLLQAKPGLNITAVETPQGEDVNSLLQGHDPEILQHLINERKPISCKERRQDKEPGENQEAKEPSTCARTSENEELNTTNPDKITYQENHPSGAGQDLKFTIWGGIEKGNIHRLKINLLVQRKDDDFKYYQDDVNLYSNGHLQRYIKGAAEELEVSTTVLKTTIRKLKNKIEQYRLKQIEQERKALKPKPYQMNKEEENRAIKFLKAKGLVKNTLKAIEKGGLVGEQKNGLLLFFLYLSRLFDEPLHAIIFGKSGSGKTYLQTKISECLPEESVRTITSLTENTLYYSAKDFWKHKVLLIEDLEGVYNAFLPLREFMSKQSITKLTTDKDAKGNNIQKVLVVEGPICVSGATTQGSIYEDNANRSFLIHVDETPLHMNRVMGYQRKLQAGLVNEKEQNRQRQILKNAQRLLKKVKVINPYALELDIPDCVFKKLRTNMHYLRLIEIITFYHQWQRTWKTDPEGKPYIETTLEDIELANWLVKDTILRKSDELSGDLRSFFESLKHYLKNHENSEEKTSFYAKDIRKHFRMHPQKLRRYLINLEKRGLIKLVNNNRQTGYEYQIIRWDDYQLLKNNVDVLDQVLEKLKQKHQG